MEHHLICFSAFNLESTITQLPQGSVYEKYITYLTDDNDTTCVQILPSSSRLDLFKIKIFNSKLCSNVSKVDVMLVNLPCSPNNIVVYSPTVANKVTYDQFTGRFQRYKYCNNDATRSQYVCSFVISDENNLTCDFVFIVLHHIPTSEHVEICEIAFDVN